MPPERRQPKPWPMKWIVLVIVLFIGIYTALTLHYRKASPAFQPYQDMQERANVVRLLAAGYQRTIVTPAFPADPPRPGMNGATADAPAGLPPTLQETLVSQPRLPAAYSGLAAPATASTLRPYSVQFTCTLPDEKGQLSSAQVFTREGELIIAPVFEPVSGGLLARSRDSVVQLSIPSGVLKPGVYHVTLAGAHASKAWTLQVH